MSDSRRTSTKRVSIKATQSIDQIADGLKDALEVGGDTSSAAPQRLSAAQRSDASSAAPRRLSAAQRGDASTATTQPLSADQLRQFEPSPVGPALESPEAQIKRTSKGVIFRRSQNDKIRRSQQRIDALFDDVNLENEAPPAAEEMNHSVRRTIFAMAIGSLALEVLFAAYNVKYGKKGLEMLLEHLGFTNIPGAPLWTTAIVLASIDLLANLTLFDPVEESEKWGKTMAPGIRKTVWEFLKNNLNSVRNIINFTIPTLGMAISFPVGTWADIEPFKDMLQTHLGFYQWIPIGLVELLGCTYYVVQSAQDAYDGMRFYLNDPAVRLSPPQEPLLQQFLNGNCANAIQSLMERGVASGFRATSFAFLLMRLVEQVGFGEYTNVAKVVGFVACIAAFDTARGPTSYRAHFGKEGNRLDLVTDADRVEAESRMTKKEIVKREVFTATKDSFIAGLVGLAFYYTLGTFIKASILAMNGNMGNNTGTFNDTGTFNNTGTPQGGQNAATPLLDMLPLMIAFLSGAAMFFVICRPAAVKKSLNENTLAFAKTDVATQIALFPTLGNDGTRRTCIEKIRHYEELLSIAENERFVIGDPMPAYVDRFAQARNQNSNKPIPSPFTETVSFGIALGSWTARGLTGIFSTQRVFGKSLPDGAGVLAATFTNGVLIQNGTLYFAEKIAPTLTTLVPRLKDKLCCSFFKPAQYSEVEASAPEVRRSLLSDV